MVDRPRYPLSLWDVLRAVAHFAAWADYQTGGGAAPSRRAARLTYYASSGSAPAGRLAASSRPS